MGISNEIKNEMKKKDIENKLHLDVFFNDFDIGSFNGKYFAKNNVQVIDSLLVNRHINCNRGLLEDL